MNDISLDEFLNNAAFSRPDEYLEILRLAMVERRFDDLSLRSHLLTANGFWVRDPADAVRRFWQIIRDNTDYLFDLNDINGENMRHWGIRLFDPGRWADDIAHEQLIVPIAEAETRTASGRGATIRHHNTGATGFYSETVGQNSYDADFFRPRYDLEIICQLARMINFCHRYWFVFRYNTFSVPGVTECSRGDGRVGVHLFAIKLSFRDPELCEFYNFFNGVLAPGRYDVEENFNLPEKEDDNQYLCCAGFFDFCQGDGLRYLY